MGETHRLESEHPKIWNPAGKLDCVRADVGTDVDENPRGWQLGGKNLDFWPLVVDAQLGPECASGDFWRVSPVTAVSVLDPDTVSLEVDGVGSGATQQVRPF